MDLLDKKICPLTKADCYGCECGMWHGDRCAVVSLARKAVDISGDIFWIRRAVEEEYL